MKNMLFLVFVFAIVLSFSSEASAQWTMNTFTANGSGVDIPIDGDGPTSSAWNATLSKRPTAGGPWIALETDNGITDANGNWAGEFKLSDTKIVNWPSGGAVTLGDQLFSGGVAVTAIFEWTW